MTVAPCDCGRCRICWLWQHDERYRRLWANRPAPKPASSGVSSESGRKADCAHLGDFVQPPGERTDALGNRCNCAGLALRGCDLHGICRVSDRRGAEKCCQDCGDYSP